MLLLFEALLLGDLYLYITVYSRGVNLYVFHVSLTDFHYFDWITDVRGNPYIFFFTTRDFHELSIKMAFVETICLP